jgi:hypothetical protein
MRALLLLALASCTHDISVFDQADVQTARDLDILYVFDNSSDRGVYDQMASQLDVLQTQLTAVDGQLPSLHVGVVTTDLGTRGRLDALPAKSVGNCAGDGDAGKLVTFNAGLSFGNFLEDLRGPDGTRIRNYDDAELAPALGRLTNPAPGTTKQGCDFPQPLEAMRRALDPKVNPDFIRPDAQLSIVFLTNQDDCSLAHGAMLDPNDPTFGAPFEFRCTEQGVVCDDDPATPGTHTNCKPRDGSKYMIDVSDYQTFLTAVKPDPHDVMVSAVAGPRTPFQTEDIGVPVLLPSCSGKGGNAMPPVRIGALVDSFGGAMVNACTQDAAYQQITSPMLGHERSCFANLRQTDGDNCTVTEVAGDTSTTIARCADGNASPCWYTYDDATACPAGDHVGIAINRGASTAPAGAKIQATCFAK